MQRFSGCWILVTVVFILLVATPPGESSRTIHRSYQYHNNSLFRRFTISEMSSSWYRRNAPPSSAWQQPAEIDPRFGIDKRLVPAGPNPLHN